MNAVSFPIETVVGRTVVMFRRDTSAAWQKFNPILQAKEIAVDTDKGMIKIGDGKTCWNDLKYFKLVEA